MAMTREKRLREYEKKRRRSRRRRVLLFISIILVSVLIILVYFTKLHERTYLSYQVVSSQDYVEDMGTGFLPYRDGMVRYNRDGVISYNKNTNPIWNSSYEMLNPIGDVCGDYIVIADQGNRLIQIFNRTGREGEINSTRDIIQVQVAGQGVVAVLSEDGDSNYINLYSKDGTELVDARVTNISEEGYPIDISISDDGQKLVVSHIAVNQGGLVSYVAFYNFGAVGQNEPGRLVAGVPYNDAVIPRVAFINNDYVCVYKEDSVMLYHMEEIPELIAEQEFQGKIKSVLYDEEYFGLILDGDDTLHKKLLLYNLDGKNILDKNIDFNYDKVFLYGDEVILYNNLSVQIIKVDGTEKFSHTFSSDISAICPINGLDKYFVVCSDTFYSIQLIN